MKKPDRENVNKRILSHSTLGWFKKSPAYFKYRVEHPELQLETPAMIFGNLFHTMVLEVSKVADRFYILNEKIRPEPEKTMASKLNKEWKARELVTAGDRKIVTQTEFNNAEQMMKAVYKKAGDFIRGGESFEREINWRREGVDLKGFIDIDHTDYMVDLKTAVDATPRQWQRKAYWDYDSHRQAAMYLDGDADGMYNGDKEFYFIVVEKVPPYLVSINLVSKTKIAEGMTQYKELLNRVKACRKSGKWPDYEPIINIWE